MTNPINGVDFIKHDSHGLVHINHISDELKAIIRKNLISICHGTAHSNSATYGYKATLNSFLCRYDKKTEAQKKGTIGEFLAHLMITELFANLKISSAFFNLEEKSMKKGFDLVIYDTEENIVWITETKSGSLHKNKNHDETTLELLNTGKNDLLKRLNQNEIQYWLNAINHVRSAVKDTNDYKDALINILDSDYGSSAATGTAKSTDKNVILVSNLFEPLNVKITETPAKSINTASIFKKTLVLCIQKGTYQNFVDFLRLEAK
jgi:hypothetical protein